MIEAIDTESRTTEGDHLSVRLWLRMLACTNLIQARASGELRAAFDTTLPRFDFLSQLERNPAGLRMNEISRRMMVTGGNVTRIAEGLIAEGLISRTVSPVDRRAAIVRLTANGRRAFDEMAERHETWIVDMFAGLRPAERQQLFDLLARLKRHLNTTGGAA